MKRSTQAMPASNPPPREAHHWFRLALRYRGSVIGEVMPRALLCGGLGAIVSALHARGWPLSVPILGSLIPNIVLGLLLVFRTNTAYDRFWEGRKAWGGLVNNTRNLARQIWVGIGEAEPGDRAEKIATLRLLVAFAVAVKLHLRHEPPNAELAALMAPSRFEKLQRMNHPSLEIAFWIADYLQTQHQRGLLHVYQLQAILELLDRQTDMLGACERIKKTPMPLAYAIHLKQLLLLYCLSLPFQMVADVGWLTAPFTALTSFALLGIEEIGIEIEDPFGRDANDLPLDAICEAMLRNIEDLISLSPALSLSRVAGIDRG